MKKFTSTKDVVPTARIELALQQLFGITLFRCHYGMSALNGDGCGDRTHVIAVKEQCLNRLTKPPYISESTSIYPILVKP